MVYDDKYWDFAEMEADTEYGKDYEINYEDKPHSKVLYIAIHGGGVEVGTSELTKYLSDIENQSFYEFNAKRATNNADLHITSTHYDEPKAREMASKSNFTVSIHGNSGNAEETALGGLDEVLMGYVREELEKEGFVVTPAPKEIAGAEPLNICNVNTRNAGVQLEISTGLRKAFFKDGDWSRSARTKPENWTDKFYKYALAIQRAVSRAHHLAPTRILKPRR